MLWQEYNESNVFVAIQSLERNTRVNFSFIKNGKGLLLYSFKANVLTN